LEVEENLESNISDRAKLLGNFAGFDTSGANLHAFRAAINFGPHVLQIRFEASQRLFMSMADFVADPRPLSAYFTNLSHYSSCLPCRQVSLNIYIISH
jgi:hypothetical protein